MNVAMILAAGRGERMRPLTDTTPKALLRVAGVPLIERHVRALAASGFARIVINLGHLGAQIRQHLGDGAHLGVAIAYSEEGDTPLETGGGIARALPLIGAEVFAVVNADVYADYPWPRIAARMAGLAPRWLAHLVLVPNPPFRSEGDFSLEGERVGMAPAPRFTVSGISLARAALFAGQAPGGRFALGPLWKAAAARGEVSGERFDGRWSDVGTPQRLSELEALLAAAAGGSRP